MIIVLLINVNQLVNQILMKMIILQRNNNDAYHNQNNILETIDQSNKKVESVIK